MKDLRAGVGLAADEAARLIGVGIDELLAWEAGEKLPSELSVQRISQVYKIPENEWLQVLRKEKGRSSV